MNNICLIGRLTADPELRQTQSGISLVRFTLAVERPSNREETDFIPCAAWRQTAEFLSKYFRKGQRVGLTGTLTSRKYTDKDGKPRTAYEVTADRAEFVEARRARDVEIAPEPSAGPFAGMPGASPTEYTELSGDEDFPF